MKHLTKERIEAAEGFIRFEQPHLISSADDFLKDATSDAIDTILATLKLAEKVLGEPTCDMLQAGSNTNTCKDDGTWGRAKRTFTVMRDQMLREIESGEK